jgi:hypothetical protein
MQRLLLISCAVIGMAALPFEAHAAKPATASQTASGADLSAYKTFSWVSTKAPDGVNPVAFQQAVNDVSAAMEARGYTQANPGTPGDLSLILSYGKENRADFDTFGYTTVDASLYTVGKLSVDAFDTKTKQPVWHGQATEHINPDKVNPAAVDTAVSSLMKKWPASAAGGAPPASP